MRKLDGKIALITGADSGIGQAIAEEFAREGADIAVTFHSDHAGAETGRRVKAQNRRAIVRQVDVRDEPSVTALFEAVAGELGIPDILVNDAGVGAEEAVSPRPKPRISTASSRRTCTAPSSAPANSSAVATLRGAAAGSSISLPCMKPFRAPDTLLTARQRAVF